MAIDRSYAGVNRDRMIHVQPSPRSGVSRDAVTPLPKPQLAFVLEGSETGLGVAYVPLRHGDTDLTTLGIPTPVPLSNGPVAVTALLDGGPLSGLGLLTLQVRHPGETLFTDLAYMEFDI